MQFNETKDLEQRWGPKWRAIRYVRDVMIPALTKERMEAIMEMAGNMAREEAYQRHAFEAARRAGGDRERQLVQASEDLRAAMWDVIWDSSWADAWHLSWEVARVGVGLSAVDLMLDNQWGRAEYIAMVGPWLMSGFPDHNIWEVVNREEDAA